MLVLFLLGQTEAEAQSVRSTRSGNWSDRFLWSSGEIPRGGERVVIESGHAVTLDRNTARLKSLELLGGGVLLGLKDTLFIDSSFSGAGDFIHGNSTVFFFSSDPVSIGAEAIASYHNLTLADSNSSFGSRDLGKDLKIASRFEADFRRNDSAKIAGSGSIRVGGDFVYIGATAADWTGKIMLENAGSSDTAFLIISPTADSAFTFPQIVIDKRDTTQLVRVGIKGKFLYPQFGDTLYVSSRDVQDTSIVVKRGTLDLVRGHIRAVDSLTPPQIYIGQQTRYRTGARGELDTAFMSRFILDTNSTFEFYSDSVKDITYSIQSFSEPYFWNLSLAAPTLTGLKTQDLEIKGKLLIQNGAEINPRAGTGLHKQPTITIRGDVINESEGESGGIGAGTGGGDGMSPLDEHWVFDRPGDTIYWSGPAEMQRVTVKLGTVLSVRFIDHDHCDSLLYIDSITEEGGNCGARIIGKIFTIPYRFFQLSEKTHDFGNIGLTITTGEPYLQRTRVVRYAGYLPPGERIGIQPERTIKRYFNVISSDGPQSIAPSRITFDLHCDDVNGVDLDNAVFWRSTSNGNSWAYNGITQRDVNTLSFVRDTSDVGFPYNSNDFLWTLSTQRDDIATPTLLDAFCLYRRLDKVEIEWKTTSEINVRGFAIDREFNGQFDRIASCNLSPELLSKSVHGSDYSVKDQVQTNGLYQYKLVEISLDGLERVLASKSIRVEDVLGSQAIHVRPVRTGNKVGLEVRGHIHGEAVAEVFDATGRSISRKTIQESQNPVLDLDLRGISSQMVFVKLSADGQEYFFRVLLPAF
jgi:hypothetical protein